MNVRKKCRCARLRENKIEKANMEKDGIKVEWFERTQLRLHLDGIYRRLLEGHAMKASHNSCETHVHRVGCSRHRTQEIDVPAFLVSADRFDSGCESRSRSSRNVVAVLT